MKQQTLRDCWAKEKGAINAWCSIPSAVTAVMMSMNDFDSITIDMQHGLVDYQAALNMLQVISGSGKTPMVRVPWNEPGIIMKSLDAGALGIICPMINTPEDAIDFVGATRYAPEGHRSSGPTRALMVHGTNYHDEANEKIISLAMIETVEALENVEKIGLYLVCILGKSGLYLVCNTDLFLLQTTVSSLVTAIAYLSSSCSGFNRVLRNSPFFGSHIVI